MTDIWGKIDWRKQVFPKPERLSDDLTSIDILKAAAVTLMIVDHVGWILFPDIEWFRVIGRLCVPLWFFLIGYANTRDVPGRWFAAAVILLLSSMLVGLPALPLSVLLTMAAVRVSLDLFWDILSNNRHYFWWIVLLLVFFAIPSGLLVEYGTMGFLLAMIGYVVRNRAAVQELFGSKFPEKLTVVALASFGLTSVMVFGFPLLESMVLFAGLLGTYFVLVDFQPKTLAGTAGHVQAPLVRFMGRYTLEIYVIHLLILKVVYALNMAARMLIN